MEEFKELVEQISFLFLVLIAVVTALGLVEFIHMLGPVYGTFYVIGAVAFVWACIRGVP